MGVVELAFVTIGVITVTVIAALVVLQVFCRVWEGRYERRRFREWIEQRRKDAA